MKIAVLVMKLLVVAALFIVSNNNLHLADAADREVFTDTYYRWFETLFDDGVQFTAYVVKSDWLPKNIPLVEGGSTSGKSNF